MLEKSRGGRRQEPRDTDRSLKNNVEGFCSG
jgi:hypothetical protein